MNKNKNKNDQCNDETKNMEVNNNNDSNSSVDRPLTENTSDQMSSINASLQTENTSQRRSADSLPVLGKYSPRPPKPTLFINVNDDDDESDLFGEKYNNNGLKGSERDRNDEDEKDGRNEKDNKYLNRIIDSEKEKIRNIGSENFLKGEKEKEEERKTEGTIEKDNDNNKLSNISNSEKLLSTPSEKHDYQLNSKDPGSIDKLIPTVIWPFSPLSSFPAAQPVNLTDAGISSSYFHSPSISTSTPVSVFSSTSAPITSSSIFASLRNNLSLSTGGSIISSNSPLSVSVDLIFFL